MTNSTHPRNESLTALFEQFIRLLNKTYDIRVEYVVPQEYTRRLYDRFEVVDQSLSDDLVWNGVQSYLEKTVVPHKVCVATAFFDNLDHFRRILGPYHDLTALESNIFFHDLSKFSAAESLGYAQYNFRGLNTEKEEAAFERAWHHHKQNNPHHPEYWLNPDKTGRPNPLPMPDIYIAEMICDWIGAGKSYGNPFEKWAIQNLPTFLFHKTTANRLVDMLEIIFPNMYFEIVSDSAQVFCGERIDDLIPDHDRL